MKIMTWHSALALAVLGCLAAHPAHADVTYDFDGTVKFDDSGLFPAGTTTYTLSVTVDSTGTDHPFFSAYAVTGGTITYSTGYTGTLSSGTVTVFNNYEGKDMIEFSSLGGVISPDVVGRTIVDLSFNLTDTSESAISSDALPASINTADWNGNAGTVDDFKQPNGGQLETDGTLNSYPQAVPDAGSTMPILGLAMGGLAWLRRKRK